MFFIIILGDETLVENYKQDPKLSFVIKAIYTLAHALHDMHQDICGLTFGLCDKIIPFNGSLLKVRFCKKLNNITIFNSMGVPSF